MKKVTLWLIVLLLALVLTACGGSAEPDAEVSDTSDTEVADDAADDADEAAADVEEETDDVTMAEDSGEKTTVTWWHIQTQENEAAAWQDLADQYMEANPNVAVEITVLENEAFKQRLTTVMQSGNPPDLFQSWGGGVLWEYAEAGLLRDISAEMAGDWQDSFAAQSALALYGRDGEQYGAPWRWGAVGLFQNDDLYTEAGLEPGCAATWDDFLGTVSSLKDAGITPIALGEGDKWPGHFWWVYLAIRNGGQDAFIDAYTRNGSFTDAPFLAAGDQLADLVALEPYPDGYLGLTYGDQASAFGNGLAAMELMGQWGPGFSASQSESGEGVAALRWCPFPAVAGGAGAPSDTLGGGDGFAMGKNASDEAVDFLKFLTSETGQRRIAEEGMTPITIKGLDDTVDSDWLGQIIEARNNADYFQLYYDQFLPPAVGGVVNDAIQELYAGVTDSMGVAQQIEDSAAFELEGITREEAEEDTSSSNEEESMEEGEMMAFEPGTVTWWHIQTQENEAAAWEDLANQYMQLHPEITVEITVLENEAFKQRLTTVMQSGNPPDLFQSWGGGVLWEYSKAGLVRNIAPELAGDWQDSFATQSALNLYGQGDEFYGVPWRWGAVGLFQNDDLFEEAGLDAGCATTYDEFLDNVSTLKDAGITPVALGEGDKWPGHFWWVYLAIRIGGEQAFLDAYNRTGSFTDAPFVAAGEQLKRLVDLEPFPDGYLGLTYGDQASAFGNGLAAMELMGQWGPGFSASQSESGEGVSALRWCPFPAVAGGAGTPTDTLGGGDGFAVGVNASDAAVDFLKFITSKTGQQRIADEGMTPITIKGLDDTVDSDWLGQIIEARNGADYFQLYYDQFLPPAVGAVVNDAVQELYAGVATPEDVAAQIEDSAFFELEE